MATCSDLRVIVVMHRSSMYVCIPSAGFLVGEGTPQDPRPRPTATQIQHTQTHTCASEAKGQRNLQDRLNWKVDPLKCRQCRKSPWEPRQGSQSCRTESKTQNQDSGRPRSHVRSRDIDKIGWVQPKSENEKRNAIILGIDQTTPRSRIS